MLASTIAEFYLDADTLTLELEIGFDDLQAFGNLLPDDIYERLGNEPRPFAERVVRFFSRDLTIIADDEGPLPGRILEMMPRQRVRRDEITGEPLPVPEDESEFVVFARITYATSPRPDVLVIGGEAAGRAGIGFVFYHNDIAVNDFRYLSPTQIVELDWDDPWYSCFKNGALRRAYFAPMSGFIYVEPYEVRKEIIVRPKDLQHWIDLGLTGRDTIPVAVQGDLKRAAAEFLRTRQIVEIDGRAIEPELAQINFLERSLRSSQVIDPPVELDLDGAILGAIFVYRTTGLPERVTMTWDLFNDRISSVPASSVDQAGPLPTFLEPDFAVLEWRNFLTNPELPTLVALAAPPGALARSTSAARWPLLVVSLLLVPWCLRGARRSLPPGDPTPGPRESRRRARAVVLVLLVIATVSTFQVTTRTGLSGERSSTVVSGLLHNIYRAFDYRDEEQIYDVLAESVQGDLLTRIYLETRKGLVLANQGGARAKVKHIEVVELSAEPESAGGFVATAVWHVAGSVGHWGHIHQRRNQYRARLSVQPTDGAWKLAALEILEEARLDATADGSR
jgi:hypothetical protein